MLTSDGLKNGIKLYSQRRRTRSFTVYEDGSINALHQSAPHATAAGALLTVGVWYAEVPRDNELHLSVHYIIGHACIITQLDNMYYIILYMCTSTICTQGYRVRYVFYMCRYILQVIMRWHCSIKENTWHYDSVRHV